MAQVSAAAESDRESTGSSSYKTAVSDIELADQVDALSLGGSPVGTNAIGSTMQSQSSDSPPLRSAVRGRDDSSSSESLELTVGRLTNNGIKNKSLSYMDNTLLIEMRPGPEENDGVLFVLISRESVTHCKRSGFSYLVSDFDDDKASPKFRIDGFADLPVLVDTQEGSVGVVDHDESVAYDFTIDYHLESSADDDDAHVLARYELKCEGGMIGEIYVLSGQMTFAFQVNIEAELKALAIAYGISRAFSVHKAEVVDTRQPAYNYEKAMSELYENVFPLMEYAILRPAARMPHGGGVVFVVMDQNNESRILLYLKVASDATKEVEAIDTHGNLLFKTTKLLSLAGGQTVYHNDAMIGDIPRGTIGGMIWLTTPAGIQISCQQLPEHQFLFNDTQGQSLCLASTSEPIDTSVVTLKLTINKNLKTDIKKLFLAQIMNIALNLLRYDAFKLPRMHFFIPHDASQDRYSCQVCHSPMPLTPLEHQSNPVAILEAVCNYVIRCAGSNNSTKIQYYNVMDHATEDNLLTIEFLPSAANNRPHDTLVVRNNSGEIAFTASEILGEDILVVHRSDGELAGYHSCCGFYGNLGYKMFTVDGEEKPTTSTVRWGPNFTFNFRRGNDHLAVLQRNNWALELTILPKVSISVLDKILMIAFAMRLYYKLYRFNERPIPQIKYYYSAGTSE